MQSSIGFFNLKKFYARAIDNVIRNLINYACESNPLLKLEKEVDKKSSRTSRLSKLATLFNNADAD